MHDPMETLESFEARAAIVRAVKHEINFMGCSEFDSMVGAIRAVLELHRNDSGCSSCCDRWPCATVIAISHALHEYGEEPKPVKPTDPIVKPTGGVIIR